MFCFYRSSAAGAFIVAACSVFVGPTAADVLIDETFAHPNGNLAGQPPTPGPGGAWTAHSNGGSRPIQVASGEAVVVQGGGSGEDLNTGWGFAIGAGDTVFSAFDLRVEAGNFSEDYFAHFKTSGTFFNSRVWLAAPQAGGDYTIALSGDSSIGDGDGEAFWGADLSFGVTYRILHSYDYDTGLSRLWIDPLDVASTSITATDATFSDPMEAYTLRQDSSGSGAQFIDNLKVADSFDDAISSGPMGPTIASSTPADAATDVPVGIGTVSLVFSEALATADEASWTLDCQSVRGLVTGANVDLALGTAEVSIGTLPDGELCTLSLPVGSLTGSTTGPTVAERSLSFTTELRVGGCGSPLDLISQIQGSPSDPSWPTTPMLGQSVSVEGIVTADFQGTSGMRGFFLQEDVGDADPETSEGLFVFDGSVPAVDVEVGQRVSVTGTVSEFNDNTQISSPLVLVCDSGNALPGLTTVLLPEATDGDLEFSEGMRVTIATSAEDDAMTVSQNFFLGRYGQLTLSAPDDGDNPGRLFTPTNQFRPLTVGALDLAEENARRLLVLDDAFEVSPLGDNPNPVPFLGPAGSHIVLRAGDRATGLVGILDQGRINSFSGADLLIDYRLQPTEEPTFLADNPRTLEPDALGGSLAVAAFNVLNYFNGDGQGGGFPTSRGAVTQAELDRQSDKIVAALAAMDADIVGLIEIENDGYGPFSAIQELVNRLNAVVGAGTYHFVDPGVPQIGTDEIAVGFIYKTGTVSLVGPAAILTNTVDIRTIDTKSRPPLAQTFQESSSGEMLTVVVNHFKSKGSDCATPVAPGEILDPDTGDGQDSCNLTRISIAQALLDWLDTDPTESGDPDILIIGDLNSYAMEDPISALTDPSFDPPDPSNEPGKFPPKANADFIDLIAPFLGRAAYSFTFDGQTGYLDHALASSSLRPQVTAVTEWHINTDEPAVIDYDEDFNPPGYYDPDPYRSSDHDPVVVGLNPGLPVPGDLNGDDHVDGADRDVLRAALGSQLGDARFEPNADYDGDSAITYRDYQIWYGLYRAFVNRA